MLLVFVTILFVSVVSFIVFRTYARRVQTGEGAVEERLHRLQRAQQVGFFVLPVSVLALVLWFDLVDRTLSGVEAVVPGLLSIGVLAPGMDMLIFFIFIAVPIAAGIAGSYPSIQAMRDTEASSLQVTRQTLLMVFLTFLTVILVIEGVQAIATVIGSSTPALIASLAVVVGILYGVFPYLMLPFVDRVALSGDRRDRVERLCDDVGFAPRNLFLLEGESTKTANAMITGSLPGFRSVMLTDHLLAEFSDEELRAILAHEYGHVASRHLWESAGATVVTFGLGIALYEPLGVRALADTHGGIVGAGSFLALFVVYYVLVLGVLGYRHEFQADAFAANVAGSEATTAALDRLAETNDMRRDVELIYALATHHPPIGSRIERIRQMETS